MSGRFRDRNRRPARRAPFRPPKRRLLVVCEGRVTEPQYIQGFVKFARNSLVEVHIAADTGVPKTLVGIAKRLRDEARRDAKREPDSNLEFDEVWCVFDIDEHPHVAEAREMATANDIRLAISNPCFELWLLLHLCESPGCLPRDKVQQRLANLDPDYDKHVSFARYQPGYQDAVRRAAALDLLADQTGDPGRNPTTGVYWLTESIRSAQQS